NVARNELEYIKKGIAVADIATKGDEQKNYRKASDNYLTVAEWLLLANDYLKCTSLADFELLAKQLMMAHRYYYYDYKAGEGQTYQACRDYFTKQLRIIPRVLTNVSEISLKTTIFGFRFPSGNLRPLLIVSSGRIEPFLPKIPKALYTYESPIMIAPTAFHCLAHVDGEVATACGATEAQCCYTYNWMYSNMPEEKVLQTTGPKFLHIYLTAPNELLENLVQKADRNGYRALVVTCDHSTDCVRDHTLPLFVEASKHLDPQLMNRITIPNMNVPDMIEKQKHANDSITWTNIEWLRKLTKLPIICKGILSPADAELAVKYGANGIIVSNHGGRQIDTAPPAIECLEDIVSVVDGSIEGRFRFSFYTLVIVAAVSVFVDTGIRTGADVLKALALGARAVFIGRPILYGLACGGQNGVQRVLDILKRELINDMSCCGLTTIKQINKDILYKHT
ncbi:unnamed protein product, partial [Didymodactylos carnosus]